MNKLYYFFIFIFFIQGSCKKDTTNTAQNHSEQSASTAINNTTQQGKLLFSKYCSNCHRGVIDNATCTQAIIGITERHPNGIHFLIDYISNSAKVKANGDSYANELDKVYPSSFEHRFDTLMNEKEINILSNFIAEL